MYIVEFGLCRFDILFLSVPALPVEANWHSAQNWHVEHTCFYLIYLNPCWVFKGFWDHFYFKMDQMVDGSIVLHSLTCVVKLVVSWMSCCVCMQQCSVRE